MFLFSVEKPIRQYFLYWFFYNHKILFTIAPSMKTQDLKFSLIMAFMVTSYISFTLVIVNVGFTSNFIFIWLRSWLIAFVLATPSLLLVAPLIRDKIDKRKAS